MHGAITVSFAYSICIIQCREQQEKLKINLRRFNIIFIWPIILTPTDWPMDADGFISISFIYLFCELIIKSRNYLQQDYQLLLLF